MSRFLHLLTVIVVVLSACAPPPVVPTPPIKVTATASSAATARTSGGGDVVAVSTVMPSADTLTPTARRIIIQSAAPVSQVTVRPVPSATATAPTSPERSSLRSPDALPHLAANVPIGQRCGRLDVSAPDGQSLRANPQFLLDNRNFYEQLPEGAQVDLLDCRFWTNRDGQTWTAVRTERGKLGWMLVQPDTVVVTIYPVVSRPPKPVTGVAPGTTVSYVPPSEDTDPSHTGAVATSIGLDFIPVIGDAKGVLEAVSGRDLVTGEDLGDWRWFGLLGVVGLGSVAALRHGSDVAEGARLIGKAGNAEGLAREVGKVGQAAGEGGRLAGPSREIARNGRKLTEEAAVVAEKFAQPCSFGGLTPVQTESGLRPIAAIRSGERVLAFDERRDLSGYFTVTATFTHFDPQSLRLTIGADQIETTPEHPFYVGGQWLPAADLSVGDLVASARGVERSVTRVVVQAEPQWMYNLEIADAHTYYVGEGGWLVHNACRQALRRSLVNEVPADWRDGRVVWQAHHVVPVELEQHELVRKATGEGGWRFDGAVNGIALPSNEEAGRRLGYASHNGAHPNYTGVTRGELDDLMAQAAREERGGATWSGARYAEELNRLVARRKADIMRTVGRLG